MLKKIRNEYENLIGTFGPIFLLRVIFYPISSVFMNFFALIVTVKNIITSPILKNLNSYKGLNFFRSLNSFFHIGYADYIEKSGVNGYSFNISLGKPLGSLIQITKISMIGYKYMQVIYPSISMLLYLISFGVYFNLWGINENQLMWVILITPLTTYFYFNCFEALKYDALGWSFVPVLFYGVLTNNFFICTICLLIISLTAISVFIPISLLFCTLSLCWNPILALSLFPAFVKFLIFNLWFLIKRFQDLISVANSTGMSGQGKKSYKLSLGIDGYYFILIGIPFLLFLYFFGKDYQGFSIWEQILFATIPFLLLLVNRTILRFADDQTNYGLILFCCTFVTIIQANYYMIIVFWIAASPIPLMLTFAGFKKASYIEGVPILKPINIYSIDKAIADFIEDIPNYSRILFNYNFDPEHFPEFDGYKSIKEVIHYKLLNKDTIMLPDYYLIFDYYAGKFPLEKVFGNLSAIEINTGCEVVGANYIIHPSTNNKIPIEWQRENYTLDKILDLKQIHVDSDKWNFYPKEKPFLLLLKSIRTNNSLIKNGKFLDIKPNKIHLEIENNPVTIKFLFDKGWNCSNKNVEISQDNEFGWIQINGEVGTEITLNYN